MKRSLLLFLSLLFLGQSYAAHILRSDSIDIKKTIIHCDITDFVTKQIKAHANISIESKINGQTQVLFDLEGLQVDSVRWNGNNTPFSLSGFYLTINTPSSFNQGDTANLDIYYQGQPLQDATWGGYYFVGNYSFQMGVGFNAQPHSFGRTWHPCFDNMVERSPYEFYITTESNKMAVTNGLFLDSTTNTNGDIIWHYKLDEEIPSYLAAVAVSDYVWVKKTLTGNNGPTPAWIAAPAVDTNKVNGSFANLQSSYSMLEQHFGTHSFPKVGYTLVPFSAGAMEHATNIHIGTAFINGGLSYETLIAHELAHHWWGDLVTCRTVQDMWLNEGWASYAEQLHQEFTYDRFAYLEAYRANHFSVLSSAHISDDGYKAISPMDSLHTYGATVYNKGADMIHTLRSYLGDSLFFNGTTAFLNANKFKDISSYDLRDFLSTYTGFNMNDYFDDWIFQSGFPHYSIDSSSINNNGGNFETDVYLRHRKHQAPNYYNNVPVEIGFYDAGFNRHTYKMNFVNRCMHFNVRLGFEPQMIVIDPEQKLSDAITEDEVTIKNSTIYPMENSKSRIIVRSLNNPSDSSLVRIEHNWIAPDRFTQNPGNGYVLNDVRYWTVGGINLQNISNGVLQFIYNGTSADNYIDSSWIKNSEDSIRLFYRKDASQNWTFANDSIVTGNVNNKIGVAYVKEIKAGEYCFGIQRSNYIDPLVSDIATGPCNVVTNTTAIKPQKSDFEFYPNPTNHYIIISATERFQGYFQINDLNGKTLDKRRIALGNSLNRVNLPELAPGVYFIQLFNQKTHISKKIVIKL